MQYIWIIMLGIVYIMFLIGAIYDIYDTYQYNKYYFKKGDAFHYRELDSFTVGFIFLHFVALFLYSLMCWFCR